MHKSTFLLTLLLSGTSFFIGRAQDQMSEATLVDPTYTQYLEKPSTVDVSWDNQAFSLTDPQPDVYGQEYGIAYLSLGDSEPVVLPAYVFHIGYMPDEGGEYFPDEWSLSFALYDVDEYWDSEFSFFTITLPAGTVKNSAGAVNPGQSWTFTRSEYSGSSYFTDMTWTDEETPLKSNDAWITIDFGGYEIRYLMGEIIVLDMVDYNPAHPASRDFVGIKPTVIEIDLSGLEPGDYEVRIPAGFVTVDVDGETYLNADLWLDYTIIEGDDENGVDSLTSEKHNSAVYNLKGIRTGDTESLNNGLKPSSGIYIVNGKKIIIK